MGIVDIKARIDVLSKSIQDAQDDLRREREKLAAYKSTILNCTDGVYTHTNGGIYFMGKFHEDTGKVKVVEIRPEGSYRRKLEYELTLLQLEDFSRCLTKISLIEGINRVI